MCLSPCPGVGDYKPQHHVPLLRLWWEDQHLVVLGTSSGAERADVGTGGRTHILLMVWTSLAPFQQDLGSSKGNLGGVPDWLSLVSPLPGAAGRGGEGQELWQWLRSLLVQQAKG